MINPEQKVKALAEGVLAGNRRSIARLITLIENERPEALEILSVLFPHTGQAHLIGITGAPGTGKSSLVNALAKAYRAADKRVAILAIDPTSPFSGGAILGDRIRMQDLHGDTGAYIRSMASRGNLGGLARAAKDAVKVLDAAGFEVIFVETVGAGQSEVDIAKAAQTVIVVEAPGLGDDIQAIKAGILEIADIFVVNKADLAGANKTAASLKAMLELGHGFERWTMHHGQLMEIEVPITEPQSSWIVPVIKSIALSGEGVTEVVEAINGHRQHLAETGELAIRDRLRLAAELEDLLQIRLMKSLAIRVPPEYLSDVVAKLVNRSLAPYNAVRMILQDYGS